MNYVKLIYLSIFCGIISILSFFNIVYSYYLNLYLNLNTYIYTFIASLILTFLFYLSKSIDEKKTTIYEKIVTILIGYIFLPIIISIPFYFSIYNLTFVNLTLKLFQVLHLQDLQFLITLIILIKV